MAMRLMSISQLCSSALMSQVWLSIDNASLGVTGGSEVAWKRPTGVDWACSSNQVHDVV